MSILIRIKATGEVFDVLPGFKLEINNTSPIFNELGSKSVTTTFPKTPHNMRLLGFSNRLDIKDKPDTKIPVIVSSGSYVRDGMLYQNSAYNTENTFGIIIAFNEGIMYEAMSNILLTELSNLPVLEQPVPVLIEQMNDLFTIDDPDEKLSVFQVDFKKQTYGKDENGEEVEGVMTEYVNSPQHIDGKVQLRVRENTWIVEDNALVKINVPEGYGITPFVRVWYLLELIFDHFGFKIKENPFTSDLQLKRLCVLNNTIDSLVSGRLDYRQLMPHVTINEFLQSLYCRFGLKVFFDSNTNEVNLILIRDILRNNAVEAIKQNSLPDIDYTSAKQLKLSVAKSLDQSSTETETFEEFLFKYNHTIGTIDMSFSYAKVGGVYYDPRAGIFLQRSTINQERKLLSSIHFDWNKKVEDLETEEITSIDEALTMLHEDNTGSVYLYYGLSPQLMNSILTVNGIESDQDTDNVLAFAYDMGEAYFEKDLPERYYLGHKFGSIFPFAWQQSDVLQEDRNGNQFKYALTLVGEYGAFNNFFKEYDAFLRHSNHTVKLELHDLSYELATIDFAKKRMTDNQPLLLDKINHDVGLNKSQTAKIEARTLRLYEPYNLESEQELPVFDDILYQWVLYSDQNQSIKTRHDKLVVELKKQDVPYAHQFVMLTDGQIVEDPNLPGDRTYWFLPPTVTQYIYQVRVARRTHICKVKFVHHYNKWEGPLIGGFWVPYREDIYKDIDYQSWLAAELIE